MLSRKRAVVARARIPLGTVTLKLFATQGEHGVARMVTGPLAGTPAEFAGKGANANVKPIDDRGFGCTGLEKGVVRTNLDIVFPQVLIGRSEQQLLRDGIEPVVTTLEEIDSLFNELACRKIPLP